MEWLHSWHELARGDVEPCLYRHREDKTVQHLPRVVCGLDSTVLGEPQITGQTKEAFRLAQDRGALGLELGKLFQYAFAVAKRVRSDTAIGSNPVSVASVATRLATQIFGSLAPLTTMMIGAGTSIELAAHRLHAAGARRLIVINRDSQRACRLAQRFGGYGTSLADLPGLLHWADIVISSTGSALPVLGKGAVEQALVARRRRPMFMVDMAVPRDIEPEIGGLEDVYLYTVDDLGEVAQGNLGTRRSTAAEAERTIESEVDRFQAWRRALGAVDTIKEFRTEADSVSVRTLEQARGMVA